MQSVLVADDCAEVIEIFTYILESKNIKCIGARTETELLLRLEKTIPDLIFLDILLAEKDGREICRQIKLN